MMSGDRVLQCFAGLQVWKKRGQRAPHKPLLVLYALGRLQQNHARLQAFTEVEPALKALLSEFGPSRQSVHPEYPFWRLQADGIWEVTAETDLKLRAGSNDPLKSELRSSGAAGGFTGEVYGTLKKRPEVLRAVAHSILESHFPTSLHQTITTAVGLDLNDALRSNSRDSQFRKNVIAAWGHRCGFCGYDVKLDGVDVALQAAHIRWVQAGGPDVLNNGVACCAVHHVALDRGAIGIDQNLHIVVSSLLHGGPSLEGLFTSLHGRPLLLPPQRMAVPKAAYVLWHRQEVFRGSPRD